MRPAKAGMRLAAQRFDIAMRAINEGVYDWDIARGTTYYSERVTAALGLSAKELKKPADWHNRIHPEDRPRFDTALVAHFKGRTDRFECDFRYRAHDGSWRWARQHGISMRDARGRAVRMIGSTGDITELKRTEQALKESEERYDTAMRAINEGVYDYDIANDAIYYSDRIYEVLDTSRDLLKTAADWRRLIHPDDLPGYIAEYAAHMKGERARFALDYRYRARDGAWRWARQHGMALRDGKGHAVRVVGSVSDVTELKQTEVALKASEERYALATRAATDGIYEWNLETNVLYLSDRAKEFFALADDELTSAAWNARVHPEDFPDYRQAVSDHLKGRTPHFEHEYRIRNASGGYSWVVDRAVAVRNDTGRAKRLVGALSDVTQRKLAEIELRRARDEATAALERQAATAEILRVISSSPTDLAPVFRAILNNATRLCEAQLGILYSYDGVAYRVLDILGATPEYEQFLRRGPVRAGPKTGLGRVATELRPAHIEDVRADAAFLEGDPLRAATVNLGRTRTLLIVPMLKEGKLIGALTVYRREVRPFSEKQIALLGTFADQAVIAIENVRLFNETNEALERQTATADILKVISSSPTDVQPVFNTIVRHAAALCGSLFANVFQFDGELLHLGASNSSIPENLERLRVRYPMRPHISQVSGRVVLKKSVVRIEDALQDTEYDKQFAVTGSWRRMLGVPMLREGRPRGVIVVAWAEPGPVPKVLEDLLQTFADQAAIAIENVRLFNEIQQKSALLETASRHKSDFLASMSHELRTPLNAILGFNEMLLGRVYGEVPADMQAPLAQIQTSGKHLLRLINNVLDLAKIEAGRMEISLSDYSVHDTVESVRSTLRPLAADKGLEFFATLPDDLPLAYGDAGRITQCLMNLAGNSLKFTKAGKVEISVALNDGMLVYRVADTGIGIPPDKIDSLFTEFKQTDASIASEYGGTGLGLSISRKFVEMHGGRIWVESELGKGSTFLFEIPLRVSAGA